MYILSQKKQDTTHQILDYIFTRYWLFYLTVGALKMEDETVKKLEGGKWRTGRWRTQLQIWKMKYHVRRPSKC